MKKNITPYFLPPPLLKKMVLLFILGLCTTTIWAQNYSGIAITGAVSGEGTDTALFSATSVDNPDIAFVRTTRLSGGPGRWNFRSPDNIRWTNTATGSALTLFEFLDSDQNPVQDDYRLTFNDVDGPNNEAIEYTCDPNFRFVTGDPDVNISSTPTGILASGTMGGNAGSVMFEIKDTGTFTLILTGNSGFLKNIDFNFTEFIFSPPFIYDICAGDTDGDSVNDDADFDDDNDGILDVDEANGNNPDGDADGDGLPNFQDIEDNAGQPGIPAGDGSITDYTDANSDGIPDVYDTDGDSIPNHLDLDSDNDGIPDNVEAQSTVGYIAPSATVDGNGVPDNYGGGFTTLQNSDALLAISDGVPDYLDNDSDNDGFSDTFEAGITLTGTDSDRDGLDNATDATNDYSDANGTIDTPTALPDADANVLTGGDVDYRDTLDSDDDGVLDIDDDDDDNDGILDIVENLGNDPFGDADGDGVINFADNFDNGTAGDGSTTNYTDANNNGIPDVYDIDGDGIANHLDIDADGDNCNDVVEAGFTPSGTRIGELQGTGFSSNGLVTGNPDGYTTPDAAYVNNGPDTDTDGLADTCDTDDDNDGNPDTTDPDPTEANAENDLLTVVEGTTGTVAILDNDDFMGGPNTTITNVGSGNAGGTITFDPLSGELDYTPAAGEEGTTVTLVYSVCHTGVSPSVCEEATVVITVQTDTDSDGTPDVTDPDDDNDGNPDTSDPNPLVPSTTDDLLTVVEGTTGTVTILDNDDFIGGPNTTITNVGSGNAGGTIAFDPLSGELDYTPAAGEEGTTVTVVYSVCHTGVSPSVCEEATVVITVQTDTDSDGTPDVTDPDDDNDGNPDTSDPNPLVPSTTDDLLTVVEGTTGTVTILDNDDFIGGPNTTITNVGSGNAGGTIAFDPLSGELDYTPAAGEEGTTVTVVYSVCHTGVSPSVCEEATVVITVQTDTDSDGTPDVTDPDDDNDGNPDTSDPNPLVPTTMDDLLTVVEGTTGTVTILDNDDFMGGPNTTITNVGSGNAGGTITFDPLSGELDYTPAAGEEGTTVTVVYEVCHTGVSPSVCEQATVAITVQTDTDSDGTPDVTDPDDDNDGNPDTSDSNPLVPTTMDDLLTVVEGTTGTVTILDNDDFMGGPNTTITNVGSGNAGGTITFDPLSGELDYTPAAGEEGTTVTVVYEVCQTGVSPSVCEQATVAITVQTDTDSDGTPDVTDPDDDNDGNPDTSDSNPLVPTTMDDLLTVVEGTTGTVTILDNDDFMGGPNTTITNVGSGNAGGTIAFDPLSGELDYTPAAGEEGTTVTVVYEVCHTGVSPSVCEQATVAITVQTDTDNDGTPDVTDPDDDNDGNPDTTDPDPLVPSTTDDLLTVVEGTTGTVAILDNDDFIGGPNTTITNVGSGNAGGTIAFDPLTGELDYTPAAGEEGTTVTVVYEVCHTGVSPSVCEQATVAITVQTDTDNDGTPDVTDPDDDNDGNPDTTDPDPLVPTTMDDLLTVVEGTTGTVAILDNDDFIGGPNTTITNVGSGNAGGTIAFDPLSGELDYTPAAGEEGTTVTVVYEVCHTGVSPSVCEQATVAITVQTDTDSDGTPDVTDPDDDNDGNPDTTDPDPTGANAEDDLLTVVEGISSSTNILDNDDFSPGPNTSIIDTGAGTAAGTATFDPLTGEMSYIPTAGEGGSVVTVVYQVCNTAITPNTCAEATIVITVVGDDTDGDGIPNSLDLDDDNDGIPDSVEQGDDPTLDTDDDGIIDSLDLDADGDGVPDLIESGNQGQDADNDGQLDGPFGTDGIADDIQNTPDDGGVNFTPIDTDGDGTSDYQDIDDDGDGVDTINEDVNMDGTPIDDDTDNDGIPNYLDTDDDGDGVSTENENPNPDGDGDPLTGTIQDTDEDGVPDYLDPDDDGDGIATIDENTDEDGNPLNDDTDNDGVPNFLDPDDDGDGIPTVDENSNPNGDGNSGTPLDSDGDGTPDHLEPNNTDPNTEDNLEVFNVVTPNGDGDHDVLIISNIERFPSNQLQIFNRWGVLVYEALGYGQNGEFFRGESNARATINQERLLPVGTYFYVLTYKTDTGKTKKRSDYLYINR